MNAPSLYVYIEVLGIRATTCYLQGDASERKLMLGGARKVESKLAPSFRTCCRVVPSSTSAPISA